MRYLALIAVLAVATCTKADKAWVDRYKRSVRSDIDLYLVPERYALLESSWLKKTAMARFDRETLSAALGKYGRKLADVKVTENGNELKMQVGRISHSTAYDYDVEIPLVFNGKWFKQGVHSYKAHQQHIAPTLAKVLGVRSPNGVEIEALPILVNQSNKPAIIVVAVIDQGGSDLLRVHGAVAPRIAELKIKSADMVKAEVGHLDSHTAVGHMAIGTGAYPIKSSVIGNTFFSNVKKDGKEILVKAEIYATKDETKVTPEEMRTEALGDVMNEATGGKSVIVSQSYALRAAIGMGGHGSTGSNNFIYWLDATKSKWITDTRRYALPRVVAASDVLLNYTKNYPQGFEGYQIRDAKSAMENWGLMMSTAAETQLEGELIRAVITQEILEKKKHTDGATDLVYVSFKSADAVGHHFGYHSLEAKDTLAAIDTQIGALYDFLVKNYGDNFAFVLTADHGCAPVSEITGGARLTVEEVIATIDTLLPADAAKTESLVTFMTVGQVSLNRPLMQKHNVSLEAIITKIMNIYPDGKKFFRTILTRKDLGLSD